jgi:hypothetical protein
MDAVLTMGRDWWKREWYAAPSVEQQRIVLPESPTL